jgi:hypothetical protein
MLFMALRLESMETQLKTGKNPKRYAMAEMKEARASPRKSAVRNTARSAAFTPMRNASCARDHAHAFPALPS